MVKKRFLGLLFILAAAQNIHAVPHWSGPVSITDLYVWDFTTAGSQNYVNVRVTPYYNPESCADAQGYQLTSATDVKSFERIYAFLLSAYTTGAKVSILIDGCATKPVIKAVSFNQPQN